MGEQEQTCIQPATVQMHTKLDRIGKYGKEESDPPTCKAKTNGLIYFD